jgi:methylglutaconyl-CoA hydratase
MEGSVHFEKDNRIGRIKFFHPKGNSLPSSLLQKLVKAFKTAELDPNIGVIILESEGNAFCAGASLSELKTVKSLEEGTDYFMGFADLINTIRQMSKFVLARVHGKVVGGGVGMVSACDYAFASDTASIRLSELSIGLGPYVIEPAVSRRIGSTAFCPIILGQCPMEKCPVGDSKKGFMQSVSVIEKALDRTVNQKAAKMGKLRPRRPAESCVNFIGKTLKTGKAFCLKMPK